PLADREAEPGAEARVALVQPVEGVEELFARLDGHPSSVVDYADRRRRAGSDGANLDPRGSGCGGWLRRRLAEVRADAVEEDRVRSHGGGPLIDPHFYVELRVLMPNAIGTRGQGLG